MKVASLKDAVSIYDMKFLLKFLGGVQCRHVN